MKNLYDRSLSSTSFTLVMLAIAGTMALLLGIVGIYGVMSYAVSQRTRELAIRLALGAKPGALKRALVGNELALAETGATGVEEVEEAGVEVVDDGADEARPGAEVAVDQPDGGVGPLRHGVDLQ